MIKKALKYYLIGCGIALHIGALAGLYYVLDHFALTPRQFLVKLVEKSGLDSPLLISAVEPASRYDDHPFDGTIKTSHPRVLLPEIAGLSPQDRINFFKNRQYLYQNSPISAPALPCNQSSLSALTTCWLTTGNPEKFDLAIDKLLGFKVETPDASARYGNAWLLAFSYDLLAISPKLTNEQHQQIQNKLETALIEYLRVLDENSPSLWHGRLSLSSNAWLVATTLEANTDKRRNLVTRAQGHFLDSVQSVAITEVWPEGYNYWINNRAFYFALAASAYINGLANSEHAGEIKELLERVGRWHIYATRPDNKIQGYADEGPRLDLKDETRRVIDIIASTTGDEQLANYSLYLQNLHGRESYYRDFRWGFHLFNNPRLLSPLAKGNLADFSNNLPQAALFGRNGSNALYLRSNWDKNATHLTYRAGHNFTHHGHYDAGHFTLFKGQPLAVNSSTYGDYSGENRLNYSIRTIAKNALLIQRPGEEVSPNRFFTENVSDGGQRLTLPTGSALQSTQHWQENLYKGQHLEGAELQQFTDSANYTFIQSDLTAAYNNSKYDENSDGGKVNKVQRSLFYLKNEDILLVRDHIKTNDQSYRAKWLLHSLSKPETSSEKVLKGHRDNGILASTNGQALIREKQSRLSVDALYPTDARIHLIGGHAYRYYVEVDGNDQTLDGKNMSAGSNDAAWFEKANWRMEIFSPTPNTEQDFLVALAPSINKPHPIKATRLTTSDNQYGALLGNTAVIYTDSRGEFSIELPGNIKHLYLIGPIHQPRHISTNSQPLQSVTHKDIITRVLLPDNLTNKTLHIQL